MEDTAPTPDVDAPGQPPSQGTWVDGRTIPPPSRAASNLPISRMRQL
jgi:hypothetical protein